jgi:NADH dehydrogenase FAD-containing subunit
MDSIDSGGTADANILRQHFESQILSPVISSRAVEHGQSIIIVGAGAFGSSLALELVTHYRHKYA